MIDRETATKWASDNMERELKSGSRLPDHVFAKSWDRFLFFDPSSIFQAAFVEKAMGLLKIEGAAAACLRNLDLPGEPDLTIDSTLTGERYVSLLRGPGMWLYRMDRFVCTSDVGWWCIYCEKEMEIAVIGVRDNGHQEAFEVVFEQLRARPIERVIETPQSYGLSPDGLTPQWRETLRREYGQSEDKKA